MRVLTVRQPWAWAIVNSHKHVENRTRNIAGDYRGLVAIHAGQMADEGAFFDRRIKDARGGFSPFLAAADRGVIIGVANLWAVHQHDGSAGFRCCPNAPRYTSWAEPNVWHLCFSTPRVLPEPIRWKGALGLRELPADVAALVSAGVGSSEPPANFSDKES